MAQAVYVQTGARIDYTPAVAVTGGDIVVQNAEFVGIASADIAAGRLGALAIEGVFDVAKQVGVLTTFEVGDNVYWDDLNDRAVTIGGGNAYLGKCIRAAANNDSSVRVKLVTTLEVPLAYSTDAASSSVLNTTTETPFNKSITIPANRLKKGDVIRVRAQGIVSNQNSTDTLTIQLKIGGTTGTSIVSTGAVDPATNDIWYIEADLVIRTVGASGTFVATGLQALGVPGTVTAKPFLKASSTIDTTLPQDLIVSATWSVANAANIVRLDILDVEIISR